MRCVCCGDTVDLKDPEVFSLVARWDASSPRRCEDAIHRTCLSNLASLHRPGADISLLGP
jgi:hypothetical protein